MIKFKLCSCYDGGIVGGNAFCFVCKKSVIEEGDKQEIWEFFDKLCPFFVSSFDLFVKGNNVEELKKIKFEEAVKFIKRR